MGDTDREQSCVCVCVCETVEVEGGSVAGERDMKELGRGWGGGGVGR